MTKLDISEIEKYGEKYGTEKFSLKTNNILKENKLNIENILLSKIKPTVESMIEMLSKQDPFSLKYYQKIYKKNENKVDYKYKSFNEYMFSQYGQLGSSKIIDKKSKKEDGEYYSREEYINNKGEVIQCDIFRANGDIYDFCNKRNIADLKFEGWGFNIH